MKDKIMTRCCFTGHRPEKIKLSEEKIKEKLKIAIEKAIADGFTTFLSGMARGTDLIAAEIILEEQLANPDIKLVAASPFPGFEEKWNESDRERYKKILSLADHKVYVSQKYSPDCFQKRNMFMVDRSSRVIAVYNYTPGGTKNTVNYANKKGVEVVNVLEFS